MKNLTLYLTLIFTTMATAQSCDSKINDLEDVYNTRAPKCRYNKNTNTKSNDVVILKKQSIRRGYSKRKVAKFEKTVSVVNNKVYNSRVENLVVDSKVYDFSELDVIPLFKEDIHKDFKVDIDNFSERISTYLNDNLGNSRIDENNSTSRLVLVEFEINSKGKVVNVQVVGLDESTVLSEQVKNIIQNMEDLNPALKDGIAVNSIYYMSIPFKD